MVRSRIACACSKASSGVLASLTPPALPRPPALTWALMTVTPPISSAAALASSAVCTTLPSVTGTSCLAKSSFAWYSIRSTVHPFFSARPSAGACGRSASTDPSAEAHGVTTGAR